MFLGIYPFILGCQICWHITLHSIILWLFVFLWYQFFFVFNFLIYYLFIIFIFGCVGSSFLCEGFLQLRRVGATLHRGAWASHHRGLSCCGAEAPDAQAQQLWLTGPVAPQHVGSSQARARTHVPCIGRQTLNHCATREAPVISVLTFPVSFLILFILALYFFDKSV